MPILPPIDPLIAVLVDSAKRPRWLAHSVIPITRRRVLAGILILYGISRLGVFPITYTTLVPALVWGVVLLVLGLAMWFTLPVPSAGIAISALCAGACVGFGLDVGPLNTLAYLFYWLTIVAIIETGAIDA